MILIAFGANLDSSMGAPDLTYKALPSLFEQHQIKTIKSSRLYQTAPVPASDQLDFQNAVMLVDTKLGPYKLLTALMDIEKSLGRNRTIPNAARGIDLDIIAYNAFVLSDQKLTIPHPRMHERRFLLDPLLEIAPQWRHPMRLSGASDMIAALVDEINQAA